MCKCSPILLAAVTIAEQQSQVSDLGEHLPGNEQHLTVQGLKSGSDKTTSQNQQPEPCSSIFERMMKTSTTYLLIDLLVITVLHGSGYCGSSMKKQQTEAMQPSLAPYQVLVNTTLSLLAQCQACSISSISVLSAVII